MKQDESLSKQTKKMQAFFCHSQIGKSLPKFQEKYLKDRWQKSLGKFIISILISTPLQAAEINLFHEGNESGIEEIKEILNSRYFIPDELIKKIPTQNCEGLIKRGKLDLCLKNNGDLILVSVDRRFVNESLKAFRAH